MFMNLENALHVSTFDGSLVCVQLVADIETTVDKDAKIGQAKPDLLLTMIQTGLSCKHISIT